MKFEGRMNQNSLDSFFNARLNPRIPEKSMNEIARDNLKDSPPK